MNLINIFARGNQELFHSAFLGWLMDKSAQHGFGSKFLGAILTRCGLGGLYNPDSDFEILTEHSEGRLRFDIFLRPRDPGVGRRGIVFENKVKSFGLHSQLQQYRNAGYDVAALALLPETLDEEARAQFPVVNYSDIRDILGGIKLSKENHFHFLVREYRSYLDKVLAAYDALRGYCRRELTFATFQERVSLAVAETPLRDNDIRTFTFFYYENLKRYLAESARELVFGELGYEEAQQQNSATRWISQKNVQGPPFMEAIIYNPFGPEGYCMHPEFKEEYPFQVAPRIELWLDLERLRQAADDSELAGKIMLGFWGDGIIQMLRNQGRLNALQNRRNLHVEEVAVKDIPFAAMAERLRNMMTRVGDFRPVG